MWIFNRKKIYHGFILFEQDVLSRLFEENGIRYICKVKHRKKRKQKNWSNYDPFQTFLSHEREFNCYVSRRDYARSRELLETELKKIIF